MNCSRCKKTFYELNDFPKHPKTGYYMQSCKICYEKSNKYYNDNKEYIKELKKNKTEVLECTCGKKIKVNQPSHLLQHLATKYHREHSTYDTYE